MRHILVSYRGDGRLILLPSKRFRLAMLLLLKGAMNTVDETSKTCTIQKDTLMLCVTSDNISPILSSKNTPEITLITIGANKERLKQRL